jgi:uncharacterized phiE125 gp8 family phage protein
MLNTNASSVRKLPQPLTKTANVSSDLPVSLADAKDHLRITSDDLDTEIAAVTEAAVDYCEQYAAVSLRVATQRVATYRAMPSGFVRFQTQRVISVDSVQYYDTDDNLQTIDAANYNLIESTGGGAILEFSSGLTVSSVADRLDAVQVTYTAGYASADDVPPAAIYAIKLMLTALWGDDAPAVMKQSEDRARTMLATIEWGWYR